VVVSNQTKYLFFLGLNIVLLEKELPLRTLLSDHVIRTVNVITFTGYKGSVSGSKSIEETVLAVPHKILDVVSAARRA
jgi:hypothetical protein